MKLSLFACIPFLFTVLAAFAQTDAYPVKVMAMEIRNGEGLMHSLNFPASEEFYAQGVTLVHKRTIAPSMIKVFLVEDVSADTLASKSRAKKVDVTSNLSEVATKAKIMGFSRNSLSGRETVGLGRFFIIDDEMFLVLLTPSGETVAKSKTAKAALVEYLAEAELVPQK
jgi:hypothetical protein